MSVSKSFELMGSLFKVAVLAAALASVAACSGMGSLFQTKIEEEEIIPPDTLYNEALGYIDNQRFATAIASLEKLERQHPYSQYNEKAKVMIVFANFSLGRNDEVILAADRYIALFPSSEEIPYILYMKGAAYYRQIKDITRDQQLARDSIDTLQLLVGTYPQSKYAEEAREMIALSYDQLAGKEMSVGRYYLGNGQPAAAANRFRTVVEVYQTSTHVEEALYRLTEVNLQLGLLNEARTAAAVLGHNYPSSTWYDRAYKLLQQQGLSPQIDQGNWLSSRAS